MRVCIGGHILVLLESILFVFSVESNLLIIQPLTPVAIFLASCEMTNPSLLVLYPPVHSAAPTIVILILWCKAVTWKNRKGIPSP